MKKKGFTLIELLAVIIILAIVALVATPIILNVVNDARRSAGLSEAKMIYSGINNYCMEAKLKKQLNGTANICEDGVTPEEVKQMVNLGNAKVTKVTYDKKVTELVVESNKQIIELQPDGTFTINGESAGDDSPTQIVFTDNSGANAPELTDSLTPVYYNGTNWIVSDGTQEHWYSYDNKEWANAVVLNTTKEVGQEVNETDIDLWYVWIPRYKYTIFNGNNGIANEQEINIIFENGTATTGTVSCVDSMEDTVTIGDETFSLSETCTDTTNGSVTDNLSTYTHPAFTFGDKELTGIWVSKFEISGSASKVTVKPNVMNLSKMTISQFFTSIQNMSSSYNLTSYDSHMIKNMEWGAVAYLSHSKYGINEEIYGNNSRTSSNITYTGRSGGAISGSINQVKVQYPDNGRSTNRWFDYGYYTYDGKIVNYDGSIGDYASDRTLGTKASTTGNVYGIYDMSGGKNEYVMGLTADENNNFYPAYSGFTNVDSKYYDIYSYNPYEITYYTRGRLGDATKEIIKESLSSAGGWYMDTAEFPCEISSDMMNVWFVRGGAYGATQTVGIFAFFGSPGNDTLASTHAILTVK